MALMVSVVRCTHVPSAAELAAYSEAHRAVFGDAAEVPKFLPAPGQAGVMAVVGEVHDLEAVRRLSRTPEGDAMLRQYGFIEQLDYFVEPV